MINQKKEEFKNFADSASKQKVCTIVKLPYNTCTHKVQEKILYL